jgi:sec-independent protein translocase protein TatA
MIEIGTSNVMLAFMGLGSTEIIILAVVMLVLFGGAKLPSLMRNMGRSVNEFKTGLKEKPADEKIEDQSTTQSKSEEETPVG